VEIHTLIPQEAHVRSQLFAIPPDPSRTYAAQHLGTGCVGEKPKFSHHLSRQLLGRGFVATPVLALSSAVAFSTSSPTAEVTDDAALAAWREASCT